MEKSDTTKHRVLILSTLAFALCFAVWMTNGVLVTFLVNNGVFKWSPVQIGWLLGVPVLVGSLLRLPVGILTDKFGGRIVLAVIMLISAIPTYFLSEANSYTTFLLLSFGLGITGSSFAAGTAYCALWYPREKQGTALGIFGGGNMGAALTTLFAPSILYFLTKNGTQLEAWRELPRMFAAALVLIAVVFWLGTKTLKTAETKTMAQRFRPLKEIRVWRFGLYYFFVFGGFVALSQWLIPYYVNVYAMSIVMAGILAAVFSLPAGLIRAVGGWLADRFGARSTLLWVLSACIVLLFFLFFPRMEIKAPGQGLMASRPGVVTEVSDSEIVVNDQRYQIQNRGMDQNKNVSIRFGVHNNGDTEGFLLLPSVMFWQEPLVKAGDKVNKGDLLARGVTLIYFQANVWIFTAIVLVIGLHMGIGGGAVFKHVSDYYPGGIGTVGGIVGVLGGLGGFICPIIFGYLLKWTGVWTTCWIFLAIIALICSILQRLAIKAIILEGTEQSKTRAS